MNKLLAALLALCFGTACQQPTVADPGGGVGLESNSVGPVQPIDHPAIDITKPLHSALPQRLRVAQLRGTFPAVMGTELDGGVVTWRVGSTTLGLDSYGDTLGEADYLAITEDNLEPSPLYLKFMDDAARDVCNRALTADYARPLATERAILRFVDKTQTVANAASAVDANLRYLKLRFHGIKLEADDDQQISGLRTLFSSVTTSSANGTTVDSTDIREGWRAVCVALLVAPEFHLY